MQPAIVRVQPVPKGALIGSARPERPMIARDHRQAPHLLPKNSPTVRDPMVSVTGSAYSALAHQVTKEARREREWAGIPVATDG